MTNTLPDQANMSQLRAQAKELRRAVTGGNPAALARVRAVLPEADSEVSLRDAQLVIAREYGQSSWRDLAAAVRAFVGVLKDPARADEVRKPALRAAVTATQVLESTGNLSVRVMVGQVRSTATDLLAATGMGADDAAELVSRTTAAAGV